MEFSNLYGITKRQTWMHSQKSKTKSIRQKERNNDYERDVEFIIILDGYYFYPLILLIHISSKQNKITQQSSDGKLYSFVSTQLFG
jgi:hypothetical protein